MNCFTLADVVSVILRSKWSTSDIRLQMCQLGEFLHHYGQRYSCQVSADTRFNSDLEGASLKRLDAIHSEIYLMHRYNSTLYFSKMVGDALQKR